MTLNGLLCVLMYMYACCTSEMSLGNGVNLQPSYYNDGNVTFGWELMHQYVQIRSVRIEIEPDKVSEGKSWIEQASGQGLAIIATYHKYKALGSDDRHELMSAAQWWVDNYSSLSSAGQLEFTVNLMNEFGSHDLSADQYAAMYNEAIALVRTKYRGEIIIDLSGYGQEANVAAEASAMIHDTNIVFSMHTYPGAWNQVENRYVNVADVDTLVSTKRPCIVGEFGFTGGDGNVDVPSVVSYAKSRGFSVLGWAWNGDGGDMNMVSPAWTQVATAGSYSEGVYFKPILDLL